MLHLYSVMFFFAASKENSFPFQKNEIQFTTLGKTNTALFLLLLLSVTLLLYRMWHWQLMIQLFSAFFIIYPDIHNQPDSYYKNAQKSQKIKEIHVSRVSLYIWANQNEGNSLTENVVWVHECVVSAIVCYEHTYF